jgi:hypothetical protein
MQGRLCCDREQSLKLGCQGIIVLGIKPWHLLAVDGALVSSVGFMKTSAVFPLVLHIDVGNIRPQDGDTFWLVM